MFACDAQLTCGRCSIVAADAACGNVYMAEYCACPGFEAQGTCMAIGANVSRGNRNVVERLAKGRGALTVVACVAMGNIGCQKVIKFGRAPTGQAMAGAAIVGIHIKVSCGAARGAMTVMAVDAIRDVARRNTCLAVIEFCDCP